MKNLAQAASLLLASALLRADAFSVAPTNTNININTNAHAANKTTFKSSALYAVSTETPTTPCDIPTDIEPTTLQDASALRSAVVTNIDGDFVPLSRVMGDGDSIVVFLRHMG